MLKVYIPGIELFDESIQQFTNAPGVELIFEHSLDSLSKWEQEWEKPFLGPKEKTEEEVFSYFKHMLLSEDVPPDIFDKLTNENLEQINNYINAKMTATWFAEQTNQPPSREIITAEIVYYWMVTMNIPFECQYWHLNRLLTLIQVISRKNAPAKKMSPAEVARRNRELNNQRRAQYGTKG